VHGITGVAIHLCRASDAGLERGFGVSPFIMVRWRMTVLFFFLAFLLLSCSRAHAASASTVSE